MAFVYILKDDNDRYYVGSTTDLNRRIAQHNDGHTQTTRRMKNVQLVFQQEYETLEKAREIEYRLKKMKRRDYLDKIVKDGKIKMR